ncbi:hypothetical protein [Kineococcus arenarius]|uniref:hypothetical protein n=1 Tax=unclassified Kineococcus TaxID=2621656 RepID=UPI003D7D5857
MQKPEVQELIYGGLSEALTGTGFRLNRSQEAFARRTTTGRQSLAVPLWDYQPDFQFSLVAGIRVDAVEDVFNKFSGATGKNATLTLTTMTPLSFFDDSRPQYEVRTPEEADRAVEQLKETTRSKIVPFFEEHADTHSLDDVLHTRPQPGFDITEPFSHAMHALIVARLAGNPDYPSLVARYAAELTNLHPMLRDRFEGLLEHLPELEPLPRR